MLLRPSNAHRWVPCPGCIQLTRDMRPTPPGPAAIQGTQAHTYAAQFVKLATTGDFPKKPSIDGPRDLVEIAYRAAWETVTYIGGCDGQIGVEQSVDIGSIYPGLTGTPDLFVHNPRLNTLRVVDFKFGWGPVEAFENWQLCCYAAGVLPILTGINDDTKIQLVIIQPKAYRTKQVWETNRAGLEPYFATLKSCAENAHELRPLFKAGPHCKYCEGIGECGYITAASYLVADYMNQPAPIGALARPVSVSKELSILREASEVLSYRLLALEERAMSMISSGTAIPGYTIGSGRGSRKWKTDDENEILKLASDLGIDISTHGIMTIAQAEKSGFNKALLDFLTIKTPGKKQLQKVKK